MKGNVIAVRVFGIIGMVLLIIAFLLLGITPLRFAR